MGLDLILYKRIKPIEEMSMEEELNSELAYGRKTWAIANFFSRRCESIQDDYLFKVTKADWDEFMDSLHELNDPDFREKVEDLIDYENSNDYYDTPYNEEYEKAYEELENWLDRALGDDSGYQLGLTWELAAVLRWFDADSEVREAFKNGDEVVLIQSY